MLFHIAIALSGLRQAGRGLYEQCIPGRVAGGRDAFRAGMESDHPRGSDLPGNRSGAGAVDSGTLGARARCRHRDRYLRNIAEGFSVPVSAARDRDSDAWIPIAVDSEAIDCELFD